MSEETTLWLTEAHLKVLVGTRTRDVFDLVRFEGPMTASEVQAKLGFPSKAVYYQLGKLVAAGLLAEQTDQGRAARYAAVATSIRMPTGFQSVQYERLAAESVTASLRKAARRFRSVADLSEVEPQWVDYLLYSTGKFRLSKEDAEDFSRRVRELLLEFGRRKPSSIEAAAVECVVVCTPTPSKPDATG